jgi:hypothetical protein
LTARRLTPLLLTALLAAGCGPEPAVAPAAPSNALRGAPSFTTLGNLGYPLSGTAPDRVLLALVDGHYAPDPATPDAERLVSDAELEALHAIGDLDGDGSPDAAVVLAWSGGGSGTFFELFAVLNEAGGLRPLEGLQLGDRIDLKQIAVQEGRIRVGFVGAGPDDAACCPSKRFDKAYAIEAGKLVEVAVPGASL